MLNQKEIDELGDPIAAGVKAAFEQVQKTTINGKVTSHDLWIIENTVKITIEALEKNNLLTKQKKLIQ